MTGAMDKPRLQIAIFVMTFVLPVISTFTFKISGNISSITMENKRERMLPIAFAVVTYAISTFFCYKYVIFEPIFFKTMGLITLVLFLILITNFFDKVSAHAAGNGGFLAILLVLPFDKSENYFVYLLCGYALIVGLVMSSRLALKAHTLRQVAIGFLIGFLVCFELKFII